MPRRPTNIPLLQSLRRKHFKPYQSNITTNFPLSFFKFHFSLIALLLYFLDKMKISSALRMMPLYST